MDVSDDNKTAYVTCHYCPAMKIKLQSLKNNVEALVQTHVDSIRHKTNCTQTRMTQFLISAKRKRLEDFTNPFMAALCFGYIPSPEAESYMNEMQLLHDFDMSKDSGFFPDISKRNVYLRSDSTSPILSTLGSFRNDRCIHFTKSNVYPLAGHCCLDCMRIPNNRQFNSLLYMVTQGSNKKDLLNMTL